MVYTHIVFTLPCSLLSLCLKLTVPPCRRATMTHAMDGDDSASDTDSVSLLCGLDGSRTKGVAKEMELVELDPDTVSGSDSCTGGFPSSTSFIPNSGTVR